MQQIEHNRKEEHVTTNKKTNCNVLVCDKCWKGFVTASAFCKFVASFSLIVLAWVQA